MSFTAVACLLCKSSVWRPTFSEQADPVVLQNKPELEERQEQEVPVPPFQNVAL